MMNASHPSIESLLTQLTEFPEVGTGIVRVVRTINGKRTEFILELITQQATWGLSNRNQEQDYHRLHEMLIFDDDLIEVTTLHRVRPVLEDLVRSILEQEANSGKR